MRKRIFKKAIAILLSLILVFNPVIVGVVWAQGEENSSADSSLQTSTPEASTSTQETSSQDSQSQQQETSSQDTSSQTQVTEGQNANQEEGGGQNDTPSGGSTIQTGDANSSADVDTTANSTQNTLPGEVSPGSGSCTPPEGETSCPEDVNISTDNSANVEDSAVSSAQTGDNSIVSTQGDATTQTGDATASGTIDVVVNVNSLTFEESTSSAEAQEGGQREDSGQETASSDSDGEEDGREVVVDNNNEAVVGNTADVGANTGENVSVDNAGISEITTGDAQALANIVNILNLNVVGSDFQIDVSTFEDGLEADVDLNKIWRKLIEEGGFDGFSVDQKGNITLFMIENENSAELTNDVLASSNTGDNISQGNGGGSKITTGNATSLANVFNLVNINLFGSKFYLGVVNIFGKFLGNIVIPRPDIIVDFDTGETSQGLTGGQTQGGVVFENENEAEVEDSVISTAQTGENTSLNNQGEGQIKTGDAISQANSTSFLNINIFRNNWFFLMINGLGKRAGKILGWFSPESSSEAVSGEPLIYSQGAGSGGSEFESNPDEALIDEIESEIIFRNKNKAKIKNNILSLANTGGNTSENNLGGSSIRTGNAMSLANLFNLVNLNILGSRWFMGVVNVLGDWEGNTVVAYPDVTVGIEGGSNRMEVGGVIEYAVSFRNEGYDLAKNVVVNLTLPKGVNYISDTSGITPLISEGSVSWVVGDLGAGEEGHFNLLARVDSSVFDQDRTSFFPKMVKEVYAEDGVREAMVVVSVSISTVDPESDLSNNSSSASLNVYKGQESQDNRLPVLQISAKNNVNDFVYPGDVVTFEVKVRNLGEVEARDAVLIHSMHNGVPGNFGRAVIKLGTIKPKWEGTLTFGVALSNGHILPEGSYHTETTVVGYAPSGTEVVSNTARTDFRIVFRYASVMPEAKAAEEVLGANEVSCEIPKVKDDILPYVLLLLMSSMYLTRFARDRLAYLKDEEKD